MRYANFYDWILLIFGVILHFICGATSVPFRSLVFRGITNTLIKGQSDYDNGTLNIEEFTQDVLIYVWAYFALGVATLGLNFLAVSQKIGNQKIILSPKIGICRFKIGICRCKSSSFKPNFSILSPNLEV